MDNGEVANASGAVAEVVRGQIATGKLKPGDLLPSETTLMQTFGVARPTMREALRILEAEGLVRVHRGAQGGARVQNFDPEIVARSAGLYLQLRGADLDDLSEARDLIEPGAVVLAAQRRTDAQLIELRRHAERAASTTNWQEFGDAATDFNLLLLHASGNITLSLFAHVLERLLRQEIQRQMERHVENPQPFIAYASRYFQLVVERIAARDGQGAASLWQQLRQETDTMRHESGGTSSTPLALYKVRRTPRLAR
jgi:DNA-binding FadR family transcriptional regulator